MTSPRPPMLFDYSGFPEESYQLSWPAAGSPALAARVRTLLDEAGILNGEDDTRGFDHGTFVPLMLTYPKAEIPAIQLSLKKGLDPAQHLDDRAGATAAARRGRLHRGQRHDLPQPAGVPASVCHTGI